MYVHTSNSDGTHVNKHIYFNIKGPSVKVSVLLCNLTYTGNAMKMLNGAQLYFNYQKCMKSLLNIISEPCSPRQM